MRIGNDIFENMSENLRDGILLFDKNDSVAYCNNAAGKIFGKTKEEIEGSKIWQFIPFEQNNDAFIDLVINSLNRPDHFLESIVDYYREDGSASKLRISVSKLTDSKGTNSISVVLLITDLTDLEKVNKAFCRYTSEDIAHFVLHDKMGESLGGKKEEVTILMSDLRGFTAISSRMDPDTLVNMINDYFSNMEEIIEKYNGISLEFLGDGIFVVFGAPKRNSNHAADAIACAIEMENTIDRVNKWNKEHGYPQLEMGIGINTGECVVGNIGSEKRMKYACMGQPVNIAGRIESFSVGGQILISEYTLKHAGVDVSIFGEQKIMPKGSADEITIYDVSGIEGDYGLHLVKKKIKLEPVKVKKELTFKILDGKMVEDANYVAQIEKMGTNNAYITCNHELEKFNNIVLDISDNLYAKVIEKDSTGYLLRFTSKPPCFDEWKSTLL